MKYFKCHPYRYTKFFRSFQHLFRYTPAEEILNKVMRYVEKTKLKGDYLEFGVYNGTSFISAIKFSRLYKLNDMRFFAFDSFKGLPEVKGKESGFFKKGDCYCNIKEFRRNLIQKKAYSNRVKIVQGWFDKVLTNNKKKADFHINKASVIMIDCDIYKSAIPVFKFIKSYLQDGTVLIFDDWFYGGEKRAFEEWLKQNKDIKVTEFHKYGWNGNSFIVNLNE